MLNGPKRRRRVFDLSKVKPDAYRNRLSRLLGGHYLLRAEGPSVPLAVTPAISDDGL
jgi:hypothetical protein